jgi:hypothetical protein
MRTRNLILSCAVAAGVLLPAQALAEVTRTVRAEIPTDGRFAIENLAGRMRVSPGSGNTVVAVATVHAEDDALADTLKFAQVTNKDGVPTWRMSYPLDKHTSYMYPKRGDDTSSSEGDAHSWFHDWVNGWFGGSSNTTTEYAGRRLKVSTSSGVLLYADIEIQIPGGKSVEGTFRNIVGGLQGEGVSGKLMFDVASGNIALQNLSGEISGDSGSGDIRALSIDGSYSCDTGSGDCYAEKIKGELVTMDTGSGDIKGHQITATRIKADTGSGNITLEETDAESIEADTGSGDVEVASDAPRLESVSVDTGSGDVTLHIPTNAGFTARADQGSGDLSTGFKDAQPIVEDRTVVGYRRGDGRIRIKVDTGSGDLRINPGV